LLSVLDFMVKFTKNRLSAGLYPDPLTELRALPRSPSWIMGKGRMEEGWKGGRGEEREEREEERRGKRGEKESIV